MTWEAQVGADPVGGVARRCRPPVLPCREEAGRGMTVAVCIRPIVGEAELDTCLDLWGTAFTAGRAFFANRLLGDRSYQLETTWVAEVDGEIASAVQIFPYQARWGSVDVLVGGIGSVATLPAYRRRGLAAAILTAQMEWMRDRGYHLSLLFAGEGVEPLYEGVGFRAWPFGTVVEVSAPGPGRADAAEVRKLAAGDWPAVQDIYRAELPLTPLGHVRSPEFWDDAVRWLRREDGHVEWMVAVEAGQVTGYLFYRMEERGPEVLEINCAEHHPAAAWALLGHVERQTAGPPLRLRLPVGHVLTTAGAVVPARSGAMWRLINGEALWEAVRPVLAARWRAARGSESVAASVVDGGFRLRLGGRDHVLGPSQLLEGVVVGFSPAAVDADVAVVFPEQVPYLWTLDHF